jgi:uncharacterized protein YaaQ
MKMIVAILRDRDSEQVTHALAEMGLSVTLIASTGGFLRQGRSTLMVGVADEEVDQAIHVINEKCEPSVEPFFRRARIFILKVEYYEQL